jgi:hypothetical protein
MSYIQGVMFVTAQTAYQVPLFFGDDSTITLHLYSSNDTVGVNSDPRTFQELLNPSYVPANLNDLGIDFVLNPSSHYSVFGIEFELSAPLLGQDSIFGWWIGATSNVLTEEQPMWGGTFVPPVVIAPTGLDFTISEVAMYLSQCSPSLGGVAALKDCGFDLPTITPGTFVINPTFPAGTWIGGSGFALGSVGCAYEPPSPGSQIRQYAIIQSETTLTQTVEVAVTGEYRLAATVANRTFGGSQKVELLVDSVSIDTISATKSVWLPYVSPAFSLSAGSHAIRLMGLDPDALDDSMFLSGVSLFQDE